MAPDEEARTKDQTLLQRQMLVPYDMDSSVQSVPKWEEGVKVS